MPRYKYVFSIGQFGEEQARRVKVRPKKRKVKRRR